VLRGRGRGGGGCACCGGARGAKQEKSGGSDGDSSVKKRSREAERGVMRHMRGAMRTAAMRWWRRAQKVQARAHTINRPGADTCLARSTPRRNQLEPRRVIANPRLIASHASATRVLSIMHAIFHVPSFVETGRQ